ncbi:hypothetical protein PUNSTDRAFT_104576 [Punctularia strigosozonata HHB-11173 SS5]|uniref:uncharacterized protein n=1 Tax=Punctularia strigosozonata (strain HHB-11173) TaxID=741275 RepID=UPI0004417DB1|nr:uncharacterized protein PUNSTDRAFT_104576 [Punctularia strigosozonata HHB-11173 SS5]EIN07086.1 hypothetical protein PUNSTDRAFT_104576 [Punctularia strigosozonata HHB-11173 SS5]
MDRNSYSILVINPNSTVSMTISLVDVVESLKYNDTRCEYFTAPSGPRSIDNASDATLSMERCLPALLPMLQRQDAFLVACYSEHPLVRELQNRTHRPVVGILEASIAAALQTIRPGECFGIVSTGAVWQELLTIAVHNFLGGDSQKFAGVETTGLSAVELHDAPADLVKCRMQDAVKRLLRGRNAVVGTICLGCAGMAGLDHIVREACVQELGDEGRNIRIIDGVKAGIGSLQTLLRGAF